MIIKLLNGLDIKINLKNYLVKKDDMCKSKFQKSIRDQLIEKYPNDNIFEEVYIPIEKFYLDFFLPSLSLVIEVNGEQHSKRIKFFHRTQIDFNSQIERDNRKKDFCKLNNFRMVEINA